MGCPAHHRWNPRDPHRHPPHTRGPAIALGIPAALLAFGLIALPIYNSDSTHYAAEALTQETGIEIKPKEMHAVVEDIHVTLEREHRPEPVDGYSQPRVTMPASQKPGRILTESGAHLTVAYADLEQCRPKFWAFLFLHSEEVTCSGTKLVVTDDEAPDGNQ